MKQLLLIFTLILSQQIYAQETIDYYQMADESANKGDFQKAIEYYNLELIREPDNYYAEFNKAFCNSFIGQLEEAIEGFNQVIKLKITFHEAYLQRALIKKHLTDYTGALDDLNLCLKINTKYDEAYLHRGIIHEYLKDSDNACLDFKKAQDFGIENLDNKIEIACSDTRDSNYANILRLTKISDDKTYGFKGINPIKVGTGILGGPSNQKEFLNLLRDKSGNIISYERMGSCCGYESENAIFGNAMVDIYEITYLNKRGKQKKTTLYISFYDYNEPRVPKGFTTIQQTHN